MARRMTLMLVLLGLFVGALGFVKYRQIRTAIAQGAAYAPPPEAVTTIVARREPWAQTLNAVGTVVASRGVTVSADLPGIVHRIAFESGKKVQAGDVLVELDARQEQAQLAAAEAQRDLSDMNLTRIGGLLAKGVVSQVENDRAVAEAKQAHARIGEIRASIERKTVRAPFAGVLGIRQVNLGQYLAGGDPIVPLQSLHPIYVSFGVPQQELGRLAVGETVGAAAGGSGPELQGKITAIDTMIDVATRNVQVQATFENDDEGLRPGMFVEVKVARGAVEGVVALPASAISYAPYGDSVFVVEDMTGPNGKSYRGVKQQFVKLGPGRGDQIAVLSGLEAGQEVVTSGVFKLRNGAAVEVNNEIQPGNDKAPKPEES